MIYLFAAIVLIYIFIAVAVANLVKQATEEGFVEELKINETKYIFMGLLWPIYLMLAGIYIISGK